MLIMRAKNQLKALYNFYEAIGCFILFFTSLKSHLSLAISLPLFEHTMSATVFDTSRASCNSEQDSHWAHGKQSIYRKREWKTEVEAREENVNKLPHKFLISIYQFVKMILSFVRFVSQSNLMLALFFSTVHVTIFVCSTLYSCIHCAAYPHIVWWHFCEAKSFSMATESIAVSSYGYGVFYGIFHSWQQFTELFFSRGWQFDVGNRWWLRLTNGNYFISMRNIHR